MPNNGPSAGGTSVTITGSGFTGATEVDVDGVAVSTFTVLNDTTITFTSAPHVPENVAVVVTTPSGTSPPNHPSDFFTYTGDWTLYIPVFNTGNVFQYFVNAHHLDTAPIVVGVDPRDVVFDPFGKVAYVTNSGGLHVSLSVIDVATKTVVTTLLLPQLTVPNVMAIHPTLPKAYVTDGSANQFAVIDLTTPEAPTVTTVVPLGVSGETTEGVAFTPDGLHAYIAGNSKGILYRIVSSTDSIDSQQSLPSGGIPTWITMRPNQDSGILVDVANTAIRTFDLTSSPPSFIGSTLSQGSSNSFSQIVASRDSTLAYDLNSSNVPSTAVHQFNVTTLPNPTLLTTTTVGSFDSFGIWLTPDAKTAFVTSEVSTTLSRIDGLPSAPVATTFTLPVSNIDSFWPCVTPDQAPVARFTFTTAPGNIAFFDGSGSISPVGTIATYVWNFGDASPPVTTTSPTVSHTYATSGPFTVTLQVVNTAGTSIASSTTFTGQTFSNHGADFAQTSLLVTFPPAPPGQPTNGSISQKADKFLTQACYENTITWSPPTSGSPPVSYIIFADTVLGTVPASGPLVLVVCSKTAHATYYIVAVSADGALSAPLVVSI